MQGKRRIYGFFVAMLVLLFAMSCKAQAAETKQQQVVRVGYYQKNNFQEGMSDEAVKSGYSYEYLQRLSYYTGWKYEYVYGSFQSLYEKLLRGEIDLMAGVSYEKKREKKLLFPGYVMVYERCYIYKHEADTSIESGAYDSYAGKSIGVVKGHSTDKSIQDWTRRNNVKAKLVWYDSSQKMFKAFDEGKIDCFASSENESAGSTAITALDKILEGSYYLCAAKERTDLLAQMNAALSEMSANNSSYIEELRDKYTDNEGIRSAMSEAERSWVNAHGKIRIAYMKDYLPYCDTTEDGELTGSLKDCLKEMARKLGIDGKVKFEYTGYENHEQMHQALKDGKVDAIFPCGGNLWHAEKSQICQTRALVTAGMNLAYIGKYDKSTVQTIAVNRNNSLQEYYTESNYPDAQILYCDSIEDCLAAVIDKRAGSTIVNAIRSNSILKNAKYKSIVSFQLPKLDDRSFGVEIGNTALFRLLNRGIYSIGSEYCVNQSYNYANQLYKYSVEDFVRDNLGKITVSVCLFIVLIVMFFMRRSANLRKQAELDKRYKKELTAALEAAQHANKAKTTFLNNMSHDIRTPMNAIIGFTTLAATHIDSQEHVKDYLGKIMTSSNHLLSLINDILDMSRIESGQVKIEENECHLPAIMHDLRNILQSDVRAKRLNFYIDTFDVIDEDIVCDKLRLNQVLLNCMSNAIKFTKPGGTVGIKIVQKENAPEGCALFEFIIKDTGIGMTKEFAKHIFEPFTREQNSTVSGIPGTGLGMSITKHIVDLMGGTIEIESEKGEGTEVCVSLCFRLGSNPNRVRVIRNLVGMHALVADDSMDTCVSVTRMLEAIGMTAEWTMSGVEAVYKAKYAYEDGKPYKAFIIDWLMPDMNGVEVVRRIRAEIGNSTPIIVLTAYDWTDIEQEAREAGVTAFCAKPLFLSDLYEVLCEGVEPEQGKTEELVQGTFEDKRILLVEDNELNMEIAVEIIRQTGAQIETAENGEVAVKQFAESEEGYYDMIFMDIQMPVMDGYEATREIRAMSRDDAETVPIIAMTANAFVEDQETAFAAGMNEHMAKPIEIHLLYDIMKKYL